MSPSTAQNIDGEDKQKELEAAVKAMDPLDDQQLAFLTQNCLVRYLRARKGDVHAAAKLLHSTLQWRKSMHLDTLSISEFPQELASGRMYVAQDSSGHSILITRKQKDAPMGRTAAEYEHYMRWLAFSLETCVRAMSGGQHQWVWILDMGSYNRANSPPVSVSLATLRVLADHYPERLHMAVFVNAPSIFSWLWGALSPFIDPVTRKKIMFLKSSEFPESVWEAAGQPPPEGHTSQTSTSSASHSASLQAFLPYAHHWAQPYDETQYRQLLAGLGWPDKREAAGQ